MTRLLHTIYTFLTLHFFTVLLHTLSPKRGILTSMSNHTNEDAKLRVDTAMTGYAADATDEYLKELYLLLGIWRNQIRTTLIRRVEESTETLLPIKCDGNHAMPACSDKQCWHAPGQPGY